MVFLLGRMGDNKKALYLIIERLGDVNRVRVCATSNLRPYTFAIGDRFCQGPK